MANTTIQLKFSTVASNTPAGLANGELAINSADGKIYYRTPGGSITYLNATYPAGLTTEVQFNDAGVMGSNSGFTFSKTNQLLTVTGSASIGGMNIVPTITSSYAKANAANVLAQAAFDKANTVSAGSGNANTSGWLANTVIFANANGYLSNTNNLQFFSSNNVLQVSSITTLGTSGNISGVNFIYANNFIANTGGYIQFADGTKQYTANAGSGSSATANAAFDKANAANVLAQAGFDFANTVNVKVDSAYAFANIANIKVDSAYAFANIANIKVDSAYAWANTINIKVDSAYTQANAANILAQAAFNAANSAGSALSQAAFNKANSANVLAQAAFDKANTGGGGSASNTSIGENIFTANGSQTSFTLSSSVTQDSVLVFVSGVLQPNSYYTVVGSNTTITLADAPAANDTVVVKKFTGGGGSGGGASVSISDAPPTSPTANSLWWQSNTGVLKIYYTDADSSQWVDAIPTAPTATSSDTLSPFLLMGA